MKCRNCIFFTHKTCQLTDYESSGWLKNIFKRYKYNAQCHCEELRVAKLCKQLGITVEQYKTVKK
jgi:hypothetical protein